MSLKKFIAEFQHRHVFFDPVRKDPAFKEIVAIAKQKHLAFQKELF